MLRCNLRTSHVVWAVISLLVLGLSALPVVVASAVRDDYVHNAEHMLMSVAGLLLGVPLAGIYRRLVSLSVSHLRPGSGRTALISRTRTFHWTVLIGVMVLDLAGMSRPVEAFVDRFALAHAAEHLVIYLLYVLFGGALFSLLTSRPLAWLVTGLYLMMLLMYLADENTVMNLNLQAR